MTAATERPHRTALLRHVLVALALALAVAAAFAVGCASTGAAQPHMRNALDELRAARGELDRALADKGGHRVRAIELVDSAIAEVQAGMDYARSR
ncbi:MAG: hypothetical protein ACM3OB_06695 [Acidobacteriota bacterium]